MRERPLRQNEDHDRTHGGLRLSSALEGLVTVTPNIGCG